MPQKSIEEKRLLSSIFSDETPLFRTPAEPEPGDQVHIRLRIQKDAEAQVTLLSGYPAQIINMTLCGSDALFDWYETVLPCPGCATVFYSFLIAWRGKYIHYLRTGAVYADSVPFPDPAHSFRMYPGFHVPEWAKGAVQYQIFPDRFYNGDPRTDVRDKEYFYVGDYVRRVSDWHQPPQIGDFRMFYGGDLQGVMQKLDYLQELGVEVLYFNPIFVSPSNHKYDTQDYDHVDPHLTILIRDLERPLKGSERKNTAAAQYILRTTDETNLRGSNAYFARFCQELHRRGMKIILDGVFNHCGSFNKWMDKEGIYRKGGAEKPGAYNELKSPYRNYFRFTNPTNYEAWWGVDTLPKLNYEQSRDLCEEIFRVAEKWASPPYSIDGWRLDVGADLGHSRAFNHLFWKEFRHRVKAANPNLVIIAEHYGDPSEWLQGDEWDSVMNYDAFMEPVTYFLTGMEKHSDYPQEDLYQNGEAFFNMMLEHMTRLPTPSLQCAMNELSNHDHSRFMTRTNGRSGRLQSAGSEAASEGIKIPVFQEAVVIQMTWPGAPTIYYGDEAGQVGWTDPDNRRTYPWGRENHQLIALHQALTRLRRQCPVLKTGSIKPLCDGYGYIAYARFDASSVAVIVCNNLEEDQEIFVPVQEAGIPDGMSLTRLFLTSDEGFQNTTEWGGRIVNGQFRVPMLAQSAAIFLYQCQA